MSFETFALNASILVDIRSLGYKAPTPIQKKTIPNTLRGHDVMGLAQTGTGKTAVFVLPILNRLINFSVGRGRATRKTVCALLFRVVFAPVLLRVTMNSEKCTGIN